MALKYFLFLICIEIVRWFNNHANAWKKYVKQKVKKDQ